MSKVQYFNARVRQGKDDYETPEHVWELFFKHYTKTDTIVWLPFYCKGTCGEFVRKHHGDRFIHVNEDFFTWQPETWDCIIDNPPYSCKRDVFEQCIKLGKPFALYVPLDTLERVYIRNLMDTPKFQLLIPKQRTDFITDYDVKHTHPPHKTVWFCYGMDLDDGRQIIFE